MKKIFPVLLMLVIILCSGCSQKEDWRYVDGLTPVPEEKIEEYYNNYFLEEYPLNSICEHILELYGEEAEEAMIKPLPIRKGLDGPNIIVYTDDEGNIHRVE